MRYLKTYEECTNKEKMIYDDCRDSWYWKISNEYPDILVAFDKLGVPQEWGEDWLWDKDNKHVEEFFIFKTKMDNGNYNWSHSGLGFQNPYYRKPPMYMGELEITDEDRELWKDKQEAKKYNM